MIGYPEFGTPTFMNCIIDKICKTTNFTLSDLDFDLSWLRYLCKNFYNFEIHSVYDESLSPSNNISTLHGQIQHPELRANRMFMLMFSSLCVGSSDIYLRILSLDGLWDLHDTYFKHTQFCEITASYHLLLKKCFKNFKDVCNSLPAMRFSDVLKQ